MKEKEEDVEWQRQLAEKRAVEDRLRQLTEDKELLAEEKSKLEDELRILRQEAALKAAFEREVQDLRQQLAREVQDLRQQLAEAKRSASPISLSPSLVEDSSPSGSFNLDNDRVINQNVDNLVGNKKILDHWIGNFVYFLTELKTGTTPYKA